jgi:hypothetical protein
MDFIQGKTQLYGLCEEEDSANEEDDAMIERPV